jgi:hypothetical protein
MLGVYLPVHTKEITPMALDDSALSDLLDALWASPRPADGGYEAFG